MLYKIAALGAALLVASCSSRGLEYEERMVDAARAEYVHDVECRKLGFVLGTDKYDHCMLVRIARD